MVKVLRVALALAGMLFFAALAPAAQPSAPAAATPSPSPSPEGISADQVPTEASAAISTLKSFEPDDNPHLEASAVRDSLPQLSDAISQLLVTGGKIPNDNASLDALRDLETNWHKLGETITEHAEVLSHRAHVLEEENEQVQAIQNRWKPVDKAVREKDANVPAETANLVRDVLDSAREAMQRIKVRQISILELQTRLGDLSGRARIGLSGVQQAIASALKSLTVRDSVPVWAAQPRPNLAARTNNSYATQLDDLSAYCAKNGTLFAVHGGIFALLLVAMLWLRRGLHQWTEEEPHLKRAAPIFDVPIATALALSFVIKGSMYAGAPTLFRAVIGAFILLPTIIILRRLLDPRLDMVLYSLVAFFAMDQLRVATADLPWIDRWVFTFEMAAAIVVFWLLTRTQRQLAPTARAALGRFAPPLIALAIALLSTALVASVLGYVRLGTLVGTATLRSSYLAVFLYALLRVIEGLALIAVRLPPATALRMVQQHRELVHTRVYRAFRLAAMLLWLWVTLGLLQLRDPLLSLTQRALHYDFALGSAHMRVDQLVSFAVAIWLSLLASRLLRFFLDEEVYERVNLSPGLPYAISTILNYLVLLVGFLIALGLLGVDLTKVTIVAGAFSVGLGFGLQNIINNFVSGIILLFERPVKVGDVIQIGDSTGEVRRIGIRASIVRTRDGADLILPNGNLISNQVTNWTYADRSRAIEINLNLAPVPDVVHALEVLNRVAAGVSATPNRPKPQVYLSGMAASGVAVVVRAWVDHYEDWIKARSDLAIALAQALEHEQIKLM